MYIIMLQYFDMFYISDEFGLWLFKNNFLNVMLPTLVSRSMLQFFFVHCARPLNLVA